MEQPMIEVESLTKWFGPTLAVDRISFEVPVGQIVGFLGPNGAGKSTTLRILTGYLPPTAGRAQIDRQDVVGQPEEARRSIGYLPESTPLYQEMRVEEFLHFRGQLMKMPRKDRLQRIGEVCDRCGLGHQRHRIIGHLSKGNKQRVGLAQALLHNPPVLILDEPTAGLDPVQIGEVRQLIVELKGEHTILLSSHILPEVEKTADRVLIISRGRIVADGPTATLREELASDAAFNVELRTNPDSARRALENLQGVARIEAEADGEQWSRLRVVPQDGADLREAIGAAAMHNGWQIRELSRHSPSLEEMFVRITAEQDRSQPQPAVEPQPDQAVTVNEK
jgi:ABC-2 type transport system ATP-binding protein